MKAIYKFALLCTFLFSANVLYGQTSEREKGIDLYNQGEYQKTVEILQTVVKADKNDETALALPGNEPGKNERIFKRGRGITKS